MPRYANPRALRTALLFKLGTLVALTLALVAGALSVRGRAAPGPLSVIVIVVIAVAVFVAAAAWIVRRDIEHPLRKIARAAANIAGDDWSRRMPSHPVRELDDVSAAFDNLASRAVATRAQLVRAEKLASIGRFAAGVAHEIGKPLGSIVGHVNQLRKQLLRRSAPAAELELLAAVERESVRIEQIVRGLLDYARARPAAAGRIAIEGIIRSSVDEVRSHGLLDNIDLVLELTSQPVEVGGQIPDLQQLIVNVLTNAAEAMNGRGRLVVRLERAARFTLREPAARRTVDDVEQADGVIQHPPSSRAQQWLEGNDAAEVAKIVIADSGPGVPAALSERIFDPFFSTKPAGKGIGLGLAIAARIVENYQGTIWVTSSREGGAAFHILFPIGATPAAESRSQSGRRRYTPPLSRSRVTRS